MANRKPAGPATKSKNRRVFGVVVGAALCILVLVGNVTAQVDTLWELTQWPVSEGGNGHWYAMTRATMSWNEAVSRAGTFSHDGVSGHLATVTSAAENDFIGREVLSGGFGHTSTTYYNPQFWLGGFAAEGWRWIINEPFGYSHFLDSLPFDSGSVIAILGPSGEWSDTSAGYWIGREPQCSGFPIGCLAAVIEFDVEPVPQMIQYVEWPVSEEGNGHTYAIMLSARSWSEAEDLASIQELEGVPGHLATITSPNENQFIVDNFFLVAYPAIYFFTPQWWIGAFQPARGVWGWTTGEPFGYINWTDSLPAANTDLAAAIVAFGYDSSSAQMGAWIQRNPDCSGVLGDCLISLVEFDTEPNEPRVLHVPEEYPTIQLAIDSARNGNLVLVSPGIYHESINFRGKNITVRGADGPLHTTITNERTVTLVTFDQGETHEAVLEGFTLSGGWIAVQCVNSGPTIRRNLLIGQHVWNWAAICLSGPLDTLADPSGDPRYYANYGDAPAVIVNNTIVNSANGGISSFSVSAPTIWNNIITFNAHYGIHHQGGFQQQTPLVAYNDVCGNGDANYYNIPDPGPGSISSDPLFDTRPFAVSWSLSAESPCIDAGDPALRFNDPDGSRNDMGDLPYEYSGDGGVIPTNEWIILFCNNLRPDVLSDEGFSLIQVFDPDGVLCGEAVRYWEGSYGLLPVYRDDPYTDIDEGCEPGDQIQFKIDGVPVQPSEPVYWTANGDIFEVCSFGETSCQDIPLHTGWNLISWNVAFEGEITTALDEIIGCVDVVLSYEQGALTFDPNLDGFNTLTHVDYKHGYWIRMNCDAVLQVCGDQIPTEEWITLEPSWNLVAYWPEASLPVETGFWSILDSLQEVMGFDNGAQIWLPNMWGLNMLTELRPTFGYWVKVPSLMALSYPSYYVPDTVIALPDPQGTPEPLLSETSRDWMSVYGRNITVDGQAVESGAAIEFFTDRDVLCGRGIYANNTLKLTPVYGRDASGETAKEYPQEGDVLQIRIDDKRVFPGLVWTGASSRVQLSRLTANSKGMPESFALSQNYPNPFNPQTTIEYDVPSDGHVTLSVFNVLGQEVRTLVNAPMVAGRYHTAWDGNDSDGRAVSTGVYFYRLTAGVTTFTRKMLLLK